MPSDENSAFLPLRDLPHHAVSCPEPALNESLKIGIGHAADMKPVMDAAGTGAYFSN